MRRSILSKLRNPSRAVPSPRSAIVPSALWMLCRSFSEPSPAAAAFPAGNGATFQNPPRRTYSAGVAARNLQPLPCDRSASIPDNDLVLALRNAYERAETDGVLALASPSFLSQHGAEELFLGSFAAAGRNKGRTAAIVNSLLGGCARPDRPAPETARLLLEALDRASGSTEICPDVVTFCAAYSALARGGPAYGSFAADVLERARRHGKKLAGSKRRRAQAASRRRFGSGGAPRYLRDVETDLRAKYGPDFGVLHETDDLVVIGKPSGMVCFHRRKTTAGKIQKKHKRKKGGGAETKEDGRRRTIEVSLEDAVLDFGIPLSTLNPEGRGIVHRLDRGTSGCIVLAKNDQTHARLVTDFFFQKGQQMLPGVDTK